MLRETWASGESGSCSAAARTCSSATTLRGTVVRVRTTGIERLPSPRPGYVRAARAGGARLGRARRVRRRGGLAGMEAMSGIPGTVGAAPGAEHRRVRPGDLPDPRRGRAARRVDGRGRRPSPPPTSGSVSAPRCSSSTTARRRFVPPSSSPSPSSWPRSATESARWPGAQLRAALGLRARRRRVSLAWIRDHVLAVRRVKGHGARRRGPRHLQRRLVLPERGRVGILRAHPARRVPPLAGRPPTSTASRSFRSAAYDGVVPRPRRSRAM